MKGHAATIEREIRPDGRGLGRRGRDRPARLLRRADDLHDVVVPDRPAGSARSSTAGSRTHYHDLERGTDALAYVDAYADIESLPPARRGAARARRRWCRRSWTAAPGSRRCRASERDLLDVLVSLQERRRDAALLRRRDHRDVHLDDVRRAPHALRHRGLDDDRAAAPPGGAGGRRRRARRALRRRLGGQLPGAARDPAAGGGAQGDAAAAPAADPAAAGRQAGDRVRRPPVPAGTMVGATPEGVEPDRRGLPGPGARSTPAATSTRARRTSPTAGPGSRSAPAGTAASATRSR